MVRGERNYALSKIYRLCHGDKTIYIGSSVMTLNKRLSSHRAKARKGSPYNIHTYMREVGIQNVRIVLIENWPCQSKEELIKREQHWIENCDFPTVELKNQYNAWVSPELRRAREIACFTRGNNTVKGKARKVKYNISEKGRAAYQRKRVPIVC